MRILKVNPTSWITDYTVPDKGYWPYDPDNTEYINTDKIISFYRIKTKNNKDSLFSILTTVSRDTYYSEELNDYIQQRDYYDNDMELK